MEFVDGGNNVLLAVNSAVSEQLRDFSSECGVDLDAGGSSVVDHFNFVEGAGPEHTLFLADDYVESVAVLGKKKIKVCVLSEKFSLSTFYTSLTPFCRLG